MENFISSKKEFFEADIIRLADIGKSGVTTERPEFQKLLTKVRERTIDVVIVKDLSRLARNYLDICKLTDSIFPFMGVRLIAIADNYDSDVKQQTLIDLGTAFKSILDEYYVIQTSEKIRASAKTRISSGQLLGSMPYGYDRVDKYTAAINEKQAVIIRKVFDLFTNGKSASQIAGTLNTEYSEEKVWTSNSVRRILRCECYIGKKVSLTSRKNIKTKRREPVDSSEWYINENAFPPIIDKETFIKAQDHFRISNRKTSVVEKHIMARKLYCAGCGRTPRRSKASFACINGYFTGKQACFDGYISKELIYPAVLNKVKEYIYSSLKEFNLNYSFSDIVSIECELDRLRSSKAKIFEALLDKTISEERFRAANEKISADITEKKNKLLRCKKAVALKSKYKSERIIDTLKRLLASQELTKEHMMFVRRINVFDKEHFKIIVEEENALTILCRNVDFYEEES